MRYMLALGILLFSSGAGAAQVTHLPAWSTVSVADARAKCALTDAESGLPGGRAVGYPILAATDSAWAFLVVCERTGFRGEPTFGPAWTSQSFAEARKLCDAPSDASSLAAGQAVGEAVLARVDRAEVYLVVCERPSLK